MNRKKTNRILIPLVVVGVIILAFLSSRVPSMVGSNGGGDSPAPGSGQSGPGAVQALGDEAVVQVANAVMAHFDGPLEAGPAKPFEIAHQLPEEQGPVYAELRSEGEFIASAWAEAESWRGAIQTALRAVKVKAAQEARQVTPDAIILALTHNYHPVNLRDPGQAFFNTLRGVLGLELTHEGGIARFSPTEAVSQNREFDRFVELHQEDLDADAQRAYYAQTRAQIFEAYQFHITPGASPVATPMFRGNTLVPMEAVTRSGVRDLAQVQAEWMLNNLHDDGRMTYKWWPSVGREFDGNNMIRQFMATVCLGRIARAVQSDRILERQATNIAYNLGQFYKEEDGLGLIEYNSWVKLGAVALAAQALIERPDRERYSAVETSLLRTTYYLQQDDGSYHTFYRPVERRGDNQNFYPGETLLAWATLYEKTEDEELLERFMRSVRYYREWHWANRNPAFIPWHTQACYTIWEHTRDDELRRFVFEMNDWLVATMAQWEDVPYDDMRGRFHAMGGRYGPPHASSTGVYLEGLIDAFALARATGDANREELYRRTILRGLRSVMQLTFLDEIDMFYVGARNRVRGGVRETVYNNEIRVDNVQHNLMGILKILERFTPEDYYAE